MVRPDPRRTTGSVPTAAEARAAAEAARTRRRDAHDRRMAEAFGAQPPGRLIVATSWSATAVLAVVSVLALADGAMIGAFFVVTFAMFAAGAVVLAADVVLAAVRSARDSMGIGGIFFALDSAPRGITRSLNGSLATAVVISVVTPVAGLSRPELAFGTLAPLLQLSLTGLWSVRHGLFAERGPTGASTDGSSEDHGPGRGGADGPRRGGADGPRRGGADGN